MKSLKTYFLTGLLMLVPIFILYQAISVVSAVVTPFVALPLLVNFIIGLVVIMLLGWAMIHLFKRRIKKRLKLASKEQGWFATLASGMLELDKLSGKAHKAFNNPILYKVDDGIYKLGYITNSDTQFLNTSKSTTEAAPLPDSLWVYAPYPINFFGDMLLVERRKVHKLSTKDVQHLPLFILSAGILDKK